MTNECNMYYLSPVEYKILYDPFCIAPVTRVNEGQRDTSAILITATNAISYLICILQERANCGYIYRRKDQGIELYIDYDEVEEMQRVVIEDPDLFPLYGLFTLVDRFIALLGEGNIKKNE